MKNKFYDLHNSLAKLEMAREAKKVKDEEAKKAKSKKTMEIFNEFKKRDPSGAEMILITAKCFCKHAHVAIRYKGEPWVRLR